MAAIFLSKVKSGRAVSSRWYYPSNHPISFITLCLFSKGHAETCSFYLVNRPNLICPSYALSLQFNLNNKCPFACGDYNVPSLGAFTFVLHSHLPYVRLAGR